MRAPCECIGMQPAYQHFQVATMCKELILTDFIFSFPHIWPINNFHDTILTLLF